MTQTITQLSPDRARAWLDRWDAQQATFFADREERFAVIGDVLAHAIERPDPLIIDLGVGPGSLAARLLRRLPSAQVIGIDQDPLLLGLAEAAYRDEFGGRFRAVTGDLGEAGWLDRLGLHRAPDAFVSTTALHWLDPTALRELLRTAAGALAPGGVFVDGDHLYERTDRFDALLREVGATARTRRGEQPGEGWQEWWQAASEAPELAELWAARERTDLGHHVSSPATVGDYLAALREGGCAEVGQVWQCGDDRVIVGIR
ncbi:class I SAM-dependent methyltransferase [Naumannella huperziae]